MKYEAKWNNGKRNIYKKQNIKESPNRSQVIGSLTQLAGENENGHF